MSPKDLIEQHKVYSEELQQWVVPLIFVDQALQMKSTQDVDDNMKKLEQAMSELNNALTKLND
jgi:uncharacterized protein YukE